MSAKSIGAIRRKPVLENQLLDSFARSHPDFLRERLQPVAFAHGDVLAEAGQPIERAIFPRSGLISIVVNLQEGDAIEVAMVGVRGAVGGAVMFGGTHHVGTAFAQVPGRGWQLRREDLIDAGVASPEFRQLIFGQEQHLQAQAQQTAACNAKHSIMQRLCSWLLRARDVAGTNELLLTQENLAQMLGVQRASVSLFASQLRDLALIDYRRGRVQITDPAGLAEHACECHATLRHRRERLLEGTAPEMQNSPSC
jgi:CRP-like cAMP-binding protein